jgi:hypothetical protein
MILELLLVNFHSPLSRFQCVSDIHHIHLQIFPHNILCNMDGHHGEYIVVLSVVRRIANSKNANMFCI